MSESLRDEPWRGRDTLAALLATLATSPEAHDFFHTLRRIEALRPDAPRIGRSARPSAEPLRLGQDIELDFAPSTVSSFTERGDAPPRLGVRFLGLFGPQGPLPLHLTEFARDRQRHHADPGIARFADLFHHRVLSLFYRAWAQAQPVTHLDRPDDDQFATWLGSLFGIGPAPFRQRDAVPDDAKRFHAGTLARGVKNAEGLESVLRVHFGVSVRVEPFVAHWMPLRPQDRTRLGPSSSQLGVSAVVGSKVHSRQHKFRVHVGPLSWDRYGSFMPGSSALAVVRDWVRQYAGLGLAWDLVPVLMGNEVRSARLGRGREPARASTQLGLNSWLGCAGRPMPPQDRSDLVLNPDRWSTRRRTGEAVSTTNEPSTEKRLV